MEHRCEREIKLCGETTQNFLTREREKSNVRGKYNQHHSVFICPEIEGKQNQKIRRKQEKKIRIMGRENEESALSLSVKLKGKEKVRILAFLLSLNLV